MSAFVPSQVREFIEVRIESAATQLGGGQGYTLPPDFAGALGHLLFMLDNIPPHLMVLSGSAAAEMGESIQAIRIVLGAWRSGNQHLALQPLIGKGSWNPVTFILKHIRSLPDESGGSTLSRLDFIAHEGLKESLAADLHSIDVALDRRVLPADSPPLGDARGVTPLSFNSRATPNSGRVRGALGRCGG